MLSRSLADKIERLMPKPLFAVMEQLYAPYKRWQVARLGRRILQQLFPDGDFVVLGGPFKGMRYMALSSSSALAPKLVGSYELELHSYIERLTTKRFDRIIDIGCAEGYYAVGLARVFPSAEIHAFDSDEQARKRCLVLATRNGVEKQLRMHGYCTGEELKQVLGEATALVVCDCEGGEAVLLDPKTIPALKRADALVELHEEVVPDLLQIIRARFESTHDLWFIDPLPRDPSTYAALKRLSAKDQRLALDEFRKGKMKWLYMKPRS